MGATDTAEFSLQERGILASSATARYLRDFSEADRRPVTGHYQQQSLKQRSRKYYSRGQEFNITWQDYGQPLPSWFDALMLGFVDSLTLPPNWDSYGGGPVDVEVIHAAMNCMNSVLAPQSPAPRVVPLSSGGVQLEWHRKGIDLEIVFQRDEQASFYYRNRTTGDEGDYELRSSPEVLISALRALE